MATDGKLDTPAPMLAVGSSKIPADSSPQWEPGPQAAAGGLWEETQGALRTLRGGGA